MSARQLASIQAKIAADPDREVRRAHSSYLQDRYLVLLSRLRDRGVPWPVRDLIALLLHPLGIMPPARRPARGKP